LRGKFTYYSLQKKLSISNPLLLKALNAVAISIKLTVLTFKRAIIKLAKKFILAALILRYFFRISSNILTSVMVISPHQASWGQNWSPFSNASNYYPFSDYSSPWSSGPVYPLYIPPPQSLPPLFGLGYPPGFPPYGYGPQPILSLLNLAGLPAYFNDPNPGYPYSAGGYNFATLFATGSSPYPYASPFPAQTYSYLAPALATADPTYNIYNTSVTSTLAPPGTVAGLLTAVTFGGGGGGGIGGGGPGFAGGAVI
jgi:hypothetical protein